VLAPHLDDAVLSCWGAICDPHAIVTVATVFAGAPPPGSPAGSWDRATNQLDPRLQVERRRIEDRAALLRCGAHPVHCDLLDEQYRPGPISLVAVEDVIEGLIPACDEVWLPAGIGGHTDHLLVAEAGLSRAHDVRCILYADLPYAARDDRLVSEASQAVGFEALAGFLDTSPFIPARIAPTLRQLGPEEWTAKVEATRCYESQLAGLTNEFGPMLEDARQLGTEAFWDLGPSAAPRPPLDTLPTATTAVGAAPGDAPFLTVLVRTQGSRGDQLDDALSSLAAQTHQDFEVMLLAHDVEPEDLAALEDAVGGHPLGLVADVTVIAVSGGGRGRPLNVGVAAARGRYVAVLDDDDVALPDWVATFARLTASHPAHIARAGVELVRRVDEAWIRDEPYPADFDLVDHLVGNRTPVCGLAFPRRCFDELGLSFDEWLPVLEDWDFLLRAAPLCGVVDTAAVTSVYRRWHQGDDSHSHHPPADFAVAGRAVIERADAEPLLLPPRSVSALRRDRMTIAAQREQQAAGEAAATRLLVQSEARHQAALDHLRAEAAAHAHVLEATVEELRASTSWRVTAPLRLIGSMWVRLRPLVPSRGESFGGSTGAAVVEADATSGGTWPASYFEDLYAADPDPWGFATRWYERRKYELTVAALPLPRYRRGYEPGCSIGVLTGMLANRCDSLLASDVVEAAVIEARDRLRDQPHVEVRRLRSPSEWPEGVFDLIVISELATYFHDTDLAALVARTIGSLEVGGHVVVVHHRPHGETPQSGDGVHAVFRHHPDLSGLVNHVEAEFNLDVLQRTR